MKKLLKLPLRLAALPLIAILLVFQLISSLIVGLTSIVTNLLATVFLKPNTLITLYCNRTKAQTSVTGKCT